jgi:DNA-binding response OmpR family regulator
MTGSAEKRRPHAVLLVEDELLIRMNLSDYLQDQGFDVIEAGTAAEAVDLLQNSNIRVDLVFTDVRMPGKMDGFDLATWVCKNRHNTPVIVTSGDIGRTNTARRSAVGSQFVPKPYQLHLVAKTIAEAISVAA